VSKAGVESSLIPSWIVKLAGVPVGTLPNEMPVVRMVEAATATVFLVRDKGTRAHLSQKEHD